MERCSSGLGTMFRGRRNDAVRLSEVETRPVALIAWRLVAEFRKHLGDGRLPVGHQRAQTVTAVVVDTLTAQDCGDAVAHGLEVEPPHVVEGVDEAPCRLLRFGRAEPPALAVGAECRGIDSRS